MKYEEVYDDWKYLWNIAGAKDMTGGYVDQEDLDMLLANPTKSTAKYCLERQIGYWYEVGPDKNDEPRSYTDLANEFTELEIILNKYNCYLGDW